MTSLLSPGFSHTSEFYVPEIKITMLSTTLKCVTDRLTDGQRLRNNNQDLLSADKSRILIYHSPFIFVARGHCGDLSLLLYLSASMYEPQRSQVDLWEMFRREETRRGRRVADD